MKVETTETTTGLDRLATSEEIRSAIFLLPDYILEIGKRSSFEASSDLGGYVHVDMAERMMEILEEEEESDEPVN